MEGEPHVATSAGEPPGNKPSTSKKTVRRVRLDRHRYKGTLSAEKLRQMRSLNPFRAFLGEKRAKMKEEFPELAARDIVSRIATIWNNLPEEEKAVYRARIAKERRRIIESWGDEFATAILNEQRVHSGKQCRTKQSAQPSELESTVLEVIKKGSEGKAPASNSTASSPTDVKAHYRLPPSLAHCADHASSQEKESPPISVKRRRLRAARIPGELGVKTSIAQRSSARPGARSVKELLEAARAKKAEQEEAQSEFGSDQYLWDFQSCMEGRYAGCYDETAATAPNMDSRFLKYNHGDPFKDCFLQSFIAFDKMLDGEVHRLASRDGTLRKQLATVSKELAMKKAHDESVKVSLDKKDQDVTDALLWTDFIYRICLANALKHIRIPGFPSAATTDNVFQLLRAAASLVKQNDPKNRRFIRRFKAIMAKLSMPKAPC